MRNIFTRIMSVTKVSLKFSIGIACCLAAFPAYADDSEESVIIKGDQVSYSSLADGDTILFNDGMSNHYRAKVDNYYDMSDMSNVYLTGQYRNSEWKNHGTTLAVLPGLTLDNVYVLEEAPTQTFYIDGHGSATYPAFYIKHVESQKYIKGDAVSWTATLTESKSSATNFTFLPIDYNSKAGGGYTENMNDLSICTVHAENGALQWFGPAWSYGYSHFSTQASDCVIWNIFSVSLDNSAGTRLRLLYKKLKDKTFPVGISPGYYVESKVTAFYEALEKTKSAVEEIDPEIDYELLITTLQSTYDAAEASYIPLTGGTYYIVNHNSQRRDTGYGYNSAMEAGEDGLLYWSDIDVSNSNDEYFSQNKVQYIFELIESDDSKSFYIRSFAFDNFINFAAVNKNGFIELSDEKTTLQTITDNGDGSFTIMNGKSTLPFTLADFSDGQQGRSHVCYNKIDVDNTGSWEFIPVNARALTYRVQANNLRLSRNMRNLLRDAVDTYGKTFYYQPKGDNLITDYTTGTAASQLSTDFSVVAGSSTEKLCDDSFTTFWQLEATAKKCANPSFDIHLKEPHSTVMFNLSRLNNLLGQRNRPIKVNVYARNDESSSWKEMATLTLPSRQSKVSFWSDPVIMKDEYTNLRFEVASTYGETVVHGFPTFALSELSLYDAEMKEEYSQYKQTEGMAERVDVLGELIQEARTAIATSSSSTVLYTKLQNAMNSVLELLVDTAGLNNASFDPKLVLAGTPIATPSVDYTTGQSSTTVNWATDAFDGDFTTFYASYQKSNGWVGLDLGKRYVISGVEYCPRASQADRMELGIFEGANYPDFSDALPIYIIKEKPQEGQYTRAEIECSRGFRYVRYVGPNKARCNVSDLVFYGREGAGDDHALYQVTNLPTVTIHTKDAQEVTSKDVYLHGYVSVISDGGTTFFADSTKIRGRGNGSWTFEQKPFKLKLYHGAHILPQFPAKDKEWTLINNYRDKTLMRNLVAFEMSRRMDMEYVPACQLVDVIMNGEYRGSYQLTDQVEVEKNRIDVTKMDPTDNDFPNLTGGYFIEVDAYASSEPVHFSSQKFGTPVTVKYPKDENITPEQLNFIKGYYNTFENRLFEESDNYYELFSTVMDVNSFLRRFLVSELTGNTDAYWSVWMYKDRGSSQFLFNPVWDVDLGFNNDSRIYPVNNLGNYVVLSGKASVVAGWKQIVNQVITKVPDELTMLWSIARRDRGLTVDNLLNYVDSIVMEVNESQQLHFKRWPILNTYVALNTGARGSYEAEVAFLKDYIVSRVPWMDKKIGLVETGIHNLELTGGPRRTDGATYNLMGRRMPDNVKLQPGIYIRNGKKFVVR